MMLRNSALVLLTVFIATANAEDTSTCPPTAPYSPEALAAIVPGAQIPMVDCSRAGGYVSCQYDAAHGGGSISFGTIWDCRCGGTNWVCSFRGPGAGKDNDSTDVEDMNITDETMDTEMESGAAVSTGAVLSSLIASGAIAATVFGL